MRTHDLRVAPGGQGGDARLRGVRQRGRPQGRTGENRTLLRTVLSGAVVAVVAGSLAIAGPGIGITTLWPFLLAVGIALAAGQAALSRIGAFVLGAVVGFVGMALRAGVLPDVPLSATIVVVLAVVALTLVASLTQGLLPLWASLAGYAAFVGFYTPTFDEAPTAFLSEAPVALVTILLAAGIGTAVAIVAELAGVTVTGSRQRQVGAGEVA